MGAPAGHHDVATGKWAVEFDGATNLLAVGPNAATGSNGGEPPRRLHVAGATTVTLLDGTTNVDLPDYGAGYVWDLGVSAIVTGSGIAVW